MLAKKLISRKWQLMAVFCCIPDIEMFRMLFFNIIRGRYFIDGVSARDIAQGAGSHVLLIYFFIYSNKIFLLSREGWCASP